MAKFLIDRSYFPYDAMVKDPSWLGIVEEEGGAADADEKAEEVQADKVQSKGQPL